MISNHNYRSFIKISRICWCVTSLRKIMKQCYVITSTWQTKKSVNYHIGEKRRYWKLKTCSQVFYKTKYCYFVTYSLLSLSCRIHHMNFTFSEKIKVDKSSHLILAYISLTVWMQNWKLDHHFPLSKQTEGVAGCWKISLDMGHMPPLQVITKQLPSQRFFLWSASGLNHL